MHYYRQDTNDFESKWLQLKINRVEYQTVILIIHTHFHID